MVGPGFPRVSITVSYELFSVLSSESHSVDIFNARSYVSVRGDSIPFPVKSCLLCCEALVTILLSEPTNPYEECA